MRKAAFSLLAVIFLIGSSAMVINRVMAPTAKPNIPEFTVRLVDSSYDVPPASSINPYTGQPATHSGYHVESRTVELSIENQPFTPYLVTEKGNNWTVDFFYNVRVKGHFSEEWFELYRPSDGYSSQNYESDYTVLSYSGEYSPTEGMKSFVMGTRMIDVPAGGQLDFQVEAMIGYVHREEPIAVPGSGWVFTGETSGWSSTQTIGISDLPIATAEPLPTIWVAAIGLLVVLATIVLIVVVCAGLLAYYRKRS